MKKYPLYIVLFLTSLYFYNGCEFGVQGENPTVSNVTLNGQVVESVTGNPLSNANILVVSPDTQVVASTGSDGKFSSVLGLYSSTNLNLIISKTGYVTDTISVFANAGTVINDLLVKLVQETNSTGGDNTSGHAASIYIYSQSAEGIGVKESGAIEAAQLVFQVLDSSGVPLSLSNAVNLNFSFGSNPDGGEYLYPITVKTNTLGRATVTLNSGTKAGAAQVIAQINSGTTTIKSKPVLISIYGGLPDQGHFEVASAKLNYPVYSIVGYSIPFTAYVGDKYSNPVRPGTSVYFETTSGIIEGSNLTDNLGTATVTLLTQPFPSNPNPGFFIVTASTIDENNTTITSQTLRLLSGKPIISVNPTTFNIDNNSSQLFNYTVSDVNGNPMCEGTSIAVTVSEGNLKVEGDIAVKLPDTQSKSYTMFSFTAYDSQPDTVNSTKATILINTSGPNGDAQFSITGVSK